MNLVVFGLGYSAQAFLRRAGSRFAGIVATTRSGDLPSPLRGGPSGREASDRGGGPSASSTAGELAARPPPPAPPRRGEGSASALDEGHREITIRRFPGNEERLARDLAEADALLVSVPPGEGGDPVLAAFGEAIAAAPRLGWIGYLSTIGVYGDRGGGWVDETTPPAPDKARSDRRLLAEAGWLSLGERSRKAVQVFRLAGIYGPGRSAFDRLADGSARRVVRPGQVFNRIHVDDIASVLEASLDRPRPGAVYNVADDEPGPPQDVIAFAAELAGLPLPPEVPFAEAGLSPMAASFWGENKRVSNRLIREELGVRLRHPTYREGLREVLANEAPWGSQGSGPELPSSSS